MSQGPTVLAIDQDASNLLHLKSILDGAGYRTVCVGNLHQGRYAARIDRPRLVLLDLKEAGTGGLASAGQGWSGEDGPSVPVLFMVESPGPRERAQVFRSGGIDYLTKPLVPDEVLARVRLHLGLDVLDVSQGSGDGPFPLQPRSVAVSYGPLTRPECYLLEASGDGRLLIAELPGLEADRTDLVGAIRSVFRSGMYRTGSIQENWRQLQASIQCRPTFGSVPSCLVQLDRQAGRLELVCGGVGPVVLVGPSRQVEVMVPRHGSDQPWNACLQAQVQALDRLFVWGSCVHVDPARLAESALSCLELAIGRAVDQTHAGLAMGQSSAVEEGLLVGLEV